MNGGRSIWAVSPEERDKHDQKFDTLSPVQGFVTGEQARSFFLQSGLHSSVLAEIWALADMNKDGKMDRLEFSIAMKLIKMKLQGQNLPSVLPIIMKQPPVPAPTMPLTPLGMGAMQNIPLLPTVAVYTPMPLTSVSPMQGMSPLNASGMTLPIMPTITVPALANGPLGTLQPTPVNLTNAAPQNNYFTSSPLGFSSSHKTAVMDLESGSSISSTTTSLVSGIPQSSPTDWAVPHSSRLKYRQQFNSLDRQMIGYLSGPQVRNAMGSTSLSQSQLATIWNLADVDKDGKLKADEFILAMHLVDMAKEGQVLPLALPVALVPPSLRGIVGDSLNESTSSSIFASLAEEFTDVDPPQKCKSNLTFEDKFKENLERGNAELEKRRLALQEQQRKEDERRAQMAREEQERKEREARELELRRMREEEQRLEQQRELERQREEERLKELERKEAAKKELERQRQLELEKKKKQDFQNQKSQEQEVIIHLKSKKRSLELELEAVGNKHKKISEKLRDAQAKKKVQKIELDHINQKRDGQIIEINLLQQQFEELQRKLAQLTPEQHKLSEILQNMNMNMSASSMTTLQKSVTDKDLSCQKLKEQLDALEKEMAAKLSDMDQFKMDIRDGRENQRAQQSALNKLCSIKEDKIVELKRCKEEELEKKSQEEEEQRRIKQEKERQWQEKLRCDEEEKQRKLQKEREAKLVEEEERERQARLQAAKEERERRAQEEKERRQWEAEERKKREEDKRKAQEREKFEEDCKKREEERKKIEEERRKLEVERRKLEEERKRQEEERRRQEDEWRKEEKRRQEKERKQDELRRAEEERREEERRKEREEEERRRQRAQEAAIRDAEERKKKEVEQKWQEEEDRRRRDEERKKQEDERRRKLQEEHAVASGRLNGEKQNNSKTDIVAALLRGLEERKGSRQPLGTSHRKSAALTKFKALYPFSARNNEELSFETGDTIEVDETVEREEGWLYGSLQAKMGWLPESYVEKQPKPETASKAALKPQALLSTSRSLNDGSESNQNSAFTRTQAMGSMSTEHHQVLGKLQVKALCSWVAKTENHLNFSKEDVITILEQQENWWLGELNGVQGWFPKTYVTVLSNSDLSADYTEGFESSAADASSLEEYVALYTYESPEHGDLTFTEGDIILVSQTDGEWWRGSIGDRSGLFPSNYVKPKETDNSSLQPSVLGKKPEVVQVISAYTASGTGQLNLSPGQLIIILTKNHSGWWLGELQARGKKRQKGWFPALHVKQLGSNSGKSTPAIAPAVQVIAIYDYIAANQDELSFSKSQIINVLDKSDPDWWKGEINGITGLIPTNYVKLTTSESDPSQQWCADLTSLESMSLHEKKRQGYIHELIETEEKYMDDLQLVLEVFHKPMSESGRLTEAEMNTIFLNWTELIVSNTKLLKALRARKKMGGEKMPVQMMGDILASELAHMQAYIRFCSCQLNSAALLQQKTDQEPEFKHFLKKIATDYRCKGMPLSSFLLKPMQRITRYPLHIKNILESTPENHVDHAQLREALEKGEELCSQVNEGVREKENSDRLEWMQNHVQCEGITENLVFNSLTNCLGPRKLIHSGKLFKTKSNKELYAFLFNDFLLLTQAVKQFASSGSDKLFSPKSNTQYKMYKSPLFLNEVLVKMPSDPSSDEPIFRISHIDRVYSLKTDNINERTAWVQKTKAASEEFIETEKNKRDKAYQARSTTASGIGRLLVTIQEATELKSSKPSGRCNPYCEVTMGSQCYTSRTLNDALNPKWNFNCQFYIKDLYQDVLCITIYEREQFAPDEFLGRTELPVATIKKDLEIKGAATRKLLLHEVPTGEVWVRLDFQLFDGSTPK